MNSSEVPDHRAASGATTPSTGPTSDAAAGRRRRSLIDIFRHGTDDMIFKVSVRNALRDRGTDAKNVIDKELAQMITKRVWTLVHVSDLSQADRSRIIRSSMFIKEKFTAGGEFEKLKARLVAGGNMQDKGLYEYLAAPTVATCSVFSILSIAAAENMSISVVDIGGASLNASMSTGVEVHMRLDKTMTRMLADVDTRMLAVIHTIRGYKRKPSSAAR